jgi:hypothetical protein
VIRRNPRHTTYFDELAAALRAQAAGLLCAVAAVELLIGHAVLLRRAGFVDRFVTVETDLGLVGGSVLAWVDWPAAVEALQTGQLPCSASEGRILRIAASLAEGLPVDLGEALTSLDEANIGLVAAAVLVAGGHRMAIGELAGVVRR